MLEVCQQVGIDYNDQKQCHLLFFVFSFITEKTKNCNWSFRYPDNSDPYWINHECKRISRSYPHIDELLVALTEHKEKIEFRSAKYKGNLKNLGKLTKVLHGTNEKEVANAIISARAQYT